MQNSYPKVYKDSIDFSINQIMERKEPENVLLASPDYFDVVDVKNPFMTGQKGKINNFLSLQQWTYLKKIYKVLSAENSLKDVEVIKGAEGLEDMVFAANQTFPWIMPSGERVVVMSKMKHPSRQKEVPFFEKYFQDIGYKIIHLKNTQLFEGMGDTIPHPFKRLLYGGYGHRSETKAYDEISELLQVPVVLLELIDEKFYHLDTCFTPLDEKTVMLYPGAFTANGLKLIRSLFENVIEIPLNEAVNFALNAHLLNNGKTKTAIIQEGNKFTKEMLEKNGFKVHEISTSEFMKSGGSVFCMKMMYY